MVNNSLPSGKGKAQIVNDPDVIKTWRITAVWAFSESAFGGILHALKVPFSGVFISGAAVIFIALLAWHSDKKSTIIKAAVTVILIKALVSPHSPVTAYLSVFLQALTGQILFYYKKFFKTSALLLGILAELFSAVQKLLVLTVIYGTTLWNSLDAFLQFIISQFTSESPGLKYSYIFAGLYIFIHLLAGLIFGLAAGRIPKSVYSKTQNINILPEPASELFLKNKKRGRRWWKRPSGIAIFSLSLIIVALSYLTPFLGRETGNSVILMLLRSIFIMFVWYRVVSPLVLNFFNRYLTSKSKSYSAELSKMIGLFPRFKELITYTWNNTPEKNSVRGIKNFVINSFILLLNYEEDIYSER